MISSKTLKSQVLILFHIPGSLFPVIIKTADILRVVKICNIM